MDEKIKQAMEALEKNNMKAHYAKDRDEAKDIAMSMIDKSMLVGGGGSKTAVECGIIDELRNGYKFLDWWKPGIEIEEKHDIHRKTFNADVFITGTNALTMDGKLYNVDGWGNRVAAMTFGPRKVIVFAGRNKIVKDLDEADKRMREVAAPLNAKRLDKKTPCVNTGKCTDCDSPERICRHKVITERPAPGRFHVIIIDEELGL